MQNMSKNPQLPSLLSKTQQTCISTAQQNRIEKKALQGKKSPAIKKLSESIEIFKRCKIPLYRDRIDRSRKFVTNQEIKDKTLYTGEINKEGKPHGQGVLFNEEGGHRGSFVNETPHGRGLRFLSSGKVICGFWKRGE